MTIEPTATGRDLTGRDLTGRDLTGWWVVGVDGSECSANAAAWAAAHAPGRARGLQIVTAWEAPTIAAYPMSSPSVIDIDDTEMRVAAQRSADALARRVGERVDVPVEASMGRGGPAEVLIAASEAADLLVLGSRGRGGFARLILGSTSTQCATHASVPTVVVPEGTHPVGTRRILVGFDGSPNATEALRWAVQFASPGSTVVVAWVWDATPLAVGADAFFFPDASDLAAERFHHLLEPIQAQADRLEVTLEREFVRGTPRAVLATHSEGVDLVVLGARGHGSVGAALLGSVSTWILHHVHRPVVVVPVGIASSHSPEPPPDVFHG